MQKVVGIDVHKHQHVAALLDGVGRTLARPTFANTAKGTQQLLAWLDTHDADGALIGIENAASYGQTLTIALAHAGLQCVDVPPWRTSQQRKTLGPGKSDAIDAEAIARDVLARGATLAPALQPELVRAMGLLDSTRDQEVRDRTRRSSSYARSGPASTPSPKPPHATSPNPIVCVGCVGSCSRQPR